MKTFTNYIPFYFWPCCLDMLWNPGLDHLPLKIPWDFLQGSLALMSWTNSSMDNCILLPTLPILSEVPVGFGILVQICSKLQWPFIPCCLHDSPSPFLEVFYLLTVKQLMSSFLCHNTFCHVCQVVQDEWHDVEEKYIWRKKHLYFQKNNI